MDTYTDKLDHMTHYAESSLSLSLSPSLPPSLLLSPPEGIANCPSFSLLILTEVRERASLYHHFLAAGSGWVLPTHSEEDIFCIHPLTKRHVVPGGVQQIMDTLGSRSLVHCREVALVHKMVHKTH